MGSVTKIYIEKKKVTTNNESTTEVSTEQTIKLPQEPSFVKLYIEDIGLLHQISKSCTSLIYEMLKFMDFSGEIVLVPHRRKIICEKSNIRPTSLRTMICTLVSKNIIKRKSPMVYIMNPAYFAKGDWSNIRKQRDDFTFIINYKNNKREVKGRVTPEE